MALDRFLVITSVSLCGLLCSACTNDLQKLDGRLEGAAVEVTIHRVESAKSSPPRTVAIYGDLKIVGSKRIKSADLSCVSLAIGDARSSNIYVDRVAHVLTKKYASGEDGSINAPVYWIIPGVDPEKVDVAKTRIILDDAARECVRYF